MSIQPSIIAVALGLASAVSWGAGDFSGGFATKRANTFGVVIVSQVAGLILLALIAVLSHDPIPPPKDWLWGAAAGIVGGVGLIAFYRALATGQMGITAPVSAVFTALLPVTFTALTQGLPPAVQLVGFTLGLVGVWLLARPEGKGNHSVDEKLAPQSPLQAVETRSRRNAPLSTKWRGAGGEVLGLAILAGFGFGSFLVLIHQAGTVSAFWPLLAARGASLVFLTIVALTTQRQWLPNKRLVPFLILVGALDLAGNAFFVLAGQAGRLDVASVLSSLYPGMTVLLAVIILHERMSRWRLLGIGAALLAVVLIALP
ncbi:MAG: EamA family transporter [Aggregatilineales bacterium]